MNSTWPLNNSRKDPGNSIINILLGLKVLISSPKTKKVKQEHICFLIMKKIGAKKKEKTFAFTINI
jgi:hypothetical protein